MSRSCIEQFQKVVWDYYEAHGRHDLLWRSPGPDGSFDAYKILVSEVMLQQTQVGRVTPKYIEFLQRFPTVSKLAAAPLGEVLRVWQGLGYNRRAKFLHQAASMVVCDFGGEFPPDMRELVKLPGVGKNTAAAIYVYSFNEPAVFIETNIRTAFIHHFFKDEADIPDSAIAALVGQTLDRDEPRQWYWALMDYGSFLKKSVGNLNMLSKHYVKQSPLEGSRRQVRGQVLRLLAKRPYTPGELHMAITDSRLDEVLQALQREGLIAQYDDRYQL